METYNASTYGEHFAEVYDELHHDLDEAAVARIAAGGGQAVNARDVTTGRAVLDVTRQG